MKRRFLIIALFTALLFTSPVAVHAAESGSNLTITIVMPDAPTQTEPEKEAAPKPKPFYLYPSHVEEIRENGGRQFLRVYELEPYENPKDISCESFVRDGWNYELADITKSETAFADSKEHTETVEVNTDTNVTDVIMRSLAPMVEYNSNGYTGVLTLDIASIKVETAGMKTSSFTMTEKREYPNLSSNDTALVPKTISVSGKTYNLASVDWQAGNTVTIDYVAVPEYYTAYATYTATGSRTTVTGYITTAEYTGTVAKIKQGKTVYTATFLGTEIVPESVPLEIVEKETETAETSEPASIPETPPTEESITPVEASEPTEPASEAATEPTETSAPSDILQETENQSLNPLALIIVSVIGALAVGGGIGYFIIPKLKNKKGKADFIE